MPTGLQVGGGESRRQAFDESHANHIAQAAKSCVAAAWLGALLAVTGQAASPAAPTAAAIAAQRLNQACTAAASPLGVAYGAGLLVVQVLGREVGP